MLIQQKMKSSFLKIILFFLLILGLSFTNKTQKRDPILFVPLFTHKMKVRTDQWGSGQFLASRDDGKRKHLGLDIRAEGGTILLAPIGGIIIERVFPYMGANRYSGIVVKGTGPWAEYELTIYYLDAYTLLQFKAGEPLGIVQDITKKFPGMQNHIHIEVRKNNKLINPEIPFKPYL